MSIQILQLQCFIHYLSNFFIITSRLIPGLPESFFSVLTLDTVVNFDYAKYVQSIVVFYFLLSPVSWDYEKLILAHYLVLFSTHCYQCPLLVHKSSLELSFRTPSVSFHLPFVMATFPLYRWLSGVTTWYITISSISSIETYILTVLKVQRNIYCRKVSLPIFLFFNLIFLSFS